MVDAAVILAGGAGRRLGGVDKPALLLAGRSLLHRALDAVPEAVVVVVGPARDLPGSTLQVQEYPAGSGPAAAVAAGVDALPALDDDATVAVLAADLAGVTPATVERLAAGLGPAGSGRTGAVLADERGRRQYLLGVFRHGPLLAATQAADWAGRAARLLLGPLIDVEVAALPGEADDVDTAEQFRRLAFTDPPTGGEARF